MKEFVSEETSELYTQDNTAPRFIPTWINNHLYIFGEQHGIVLHKRGENDLHICIGIIGEDDGSWFETDRLGSSYWLDDFMKVLKLLKKWLEANAIKTKWGYEFKK